ncbi:hypothetical_protein [Candidozyma auris]|uniref:Cu(2+)-transporting P-type ATPase CCC2 n=1 Tax=Candidozyma auris TaxID=498019 RepID=UPI000D2D8542|nr:Cu(2+)-transporting P-type ATPase CCC2 [[Candida] auris]QEO24123.1 hypothetical_protein [[Candida] auris]GBL52636.1 heavy metal translocating P-type ATPase [[Candida] auris]
MESRINVDGMTCAACSTSVTEALEGISNVHSVAVSLITNEAKVVHGTEVQPQQLVQAVEECGFDAHVASSKALTNPTPHFVAKINVSGMTCGACTSSVTEALEAVPGVESASVSLLTNTASVKHSGVAVETLLRAVEDCGFDAVLDSSGSSATSQTLQNTTFSVTGMTCGACSASITEALEKLPEVVSAAVSNVTDSAVVTHTPDISADRLREIIEDCGFDAVATSTVRMGESQEDSEEEAVLQIYGIEESTDTAALQYNVEAILNSLAGVKDFWLLFKGQMNESALGPDHDTDSEHLIDELRITYSGSMLGIRTIVDALNNIDDEHSFLILNSVDQSLQTQLKLLSRVKEINHWRSTFFWSLIFGVPVIILNFTQNLPFWRNAMIFDGLYVISVIELALSSVVLFGLGNSFFKKMYGCIRRKGKNANMDVLVCMSTSISYLFSVYSVVLSVWTGQTIKPPKVLFETTVMLISFISFGKWMENKAKGATSTALSRLVSLTPTTCSIVTDPTAYQELLEKQNEEKGEVEQIADLPTREIGIDLLQTNDIAVVTAGGKIPADGVIIHGSTEVDESIITGESMPVHKRRGDTVIGGSINGPHLIHLRVTNAGKNSQLHQIINVVKESQVSKAPVQRFADYIAARFVAGVLLLSTVTYVIWFILCTWLHDDKLPKAFHKEENGKYYVCLKLAISVIVVACPCALGLAAPTAVMVGTGVGATRGALIKGGDVLEKASNINVILFDKTGTLTSGDMTISNAKPMVENLKLTLRQWWTLVGSVESNSEHPTGKAIVTGSKQKLGLTFEDDTFNTTIQDFNILTGLGVKAKITLEGKSYDVVIGNKRLLVRDFPDIREELAAILESDLRDSVATCAHVVIDGHYAGYIELVDSVKEGARDVIDHLRNVENIQVGIVTGDSTEVAERIGAQLGVPKGNIFSEVSPLEKDKVIVELRKRFGGPENISIAFVGDGINDAPALVQADIGMAISSGTDIAIDSAEIVLMGRKGSQENDLAGVITALKISEVTFRKIKLNFLFATIYNFVMLPFAMGCFLPFNLMLPPAVAAAAMACSSVSVVLNSLMLRNWKPPIITAVDADFKLEEEAVGDQFTLKDSSLAEFNSIKRGSCSAAWSPRGILQRLKRRIRIRNHGNSYELLPRAA